MYYENKIYSGLTAKQENMSEMAIRAKFRAQRPEQMKQHYKQSSNLTKLQGPKKSQKGNYSWLKIGKFQLQTPAPNSIQPLIGHLEHVSQRDFLAWVAPPENPILSLKRCDPKMEDWTKTHTH